MGVTRLQVGQPIKQPADLASHGCVIRLITFGSRRFTSSLARPGGAPQKVPVWLLLPREERPKMNAREFRPMADRCRELYRIAAGDEVRGAASSMGRIF